MKRILDVLLINDALNPLIDDDEDEYMDEDKVDNDVLTDNDV